MREREKLLTKEKKFLKKLERINRFERKHRQRNRFLRYGSLMSHLDRWLTDNSICFVENEYLKKRVMEMLGQLSGTEFGHHEVRGLIEKHFTDDFNQEEKRAILVYADPLEKR